MTRSSFVATRSFDWVCQAQDAAARLEQNVADEMSCAGVRARYALIAEAAYRRAQDRGFAPGYTLADWFAAEQELERQA